MRKAFTLVELIVVITILAILWAISFVSLSLYSKEARDSKRISEANSLLSKINIEITRGVKINDLITTGTWYTLRILWEEKEVIAWNINFDNLKESEDNYNNTFYSNIEYPIAYTKKWDWNSNYFIQLATFSEIDNSFVLLWNYYQNEVEDAPSLLLNANWDFIVDGQGLKSNACWWTIIDWYFLDKEKKWTIVSKTKEENIINNDWVIVWSITKKQEFSCNNSIFSKIWEEQIIGMNCDELLNNEWTICALWWKGNSTDWFYFSDIDWNKKYPSECNDLLTDDAFKEVIEWQDTSKSPYNWTNYINWIYFIKPENSTTEYKVYCDMNTNYWWRTLGFYWWNINSTNSLSYRNVIINWQALKTYTSNASKFPVLKNWTINNFSQVLFKWTNATWIWQKWAWSSFLTYPAWTTSIPPAYRWVENAKAPNTLYINTAWWDYSYAPLDHTFTLRDANWRSSICWWASVAGPKNCPYFWVYTTNSSHYDYTSHRELYYRNWKCFWELKANAKEFSLYSWNAEWNYNPTKWNCTFICEDWYVYNSWECVYVENWWYWDSINGYKFFKDAEWTIYPKNCNEIIQDEKYKVQWITYNWSNFVSWIYVIKSNENEAAYRAYCDMTTNWWGRTLGFYGNNAVTANDLSYKEVIIKWQAIKTYTSNATQFPVLKNWTINNFSQVLFKWTNTIWTWQKWAWSQIWTFPEWTTTIPTTYPNALNANWSTTLYTKEKWWHRLTEPITAPFSLWDVAWVSGICWGTSKPWWKNCPFLKYESSALYHFDYTSHRTLFYR